MKYLAILALLAACGDSHPATPDAPPSIDAPPSTTAVHGNLGGAPFVARDTIASTVTASGFDFDRMSTAIVINDYPGACAVETSRTGVANGRYLIFVLATTDAAGSSSPITQPGTYTINPSGTMPPANAKLVEAYFEIDDATCRPMTKQFGMSGSVTVASPTEATFDVTFASGDHITGAYRAAACSALDLNSTPTC